MCMKTNVSTLLREFPKVRRAALAGETVIIKTREGNLRLTKDESLPQSPFGCLKGKLRRSADDIDRPTSGDGDWTAAL